MLNFASSEEVQYEAQLHRQSGSTEYKDIIAKQINELEPDKIEPVSSSSNQQLQIESVEKKLSSKTLNKMVVSEILKESTNNASIRATNSNKYALRIQSKCLALLLQTANDK